MRHRRYGQHAAQVPDLGTLSAKGRHVGQPEDVVPAAGRFAGTLFSTLQLMLSSLLVDAVGEALSADIFRSGGGGSKPPITSMARAL